MKQKKAPKAGGKERGRINLSFDLNDSSEVAAYGVLMRLSKARKASAFITSLILKKMASDAGIGETKTDVNVQPRREIPPNEVLNNVPPSVQRESPDETANDVKVPIALELNDTPIPTPDQNEFSEDGIDTILDIFGC